MKIMMKCDLNKLITTEPFQLIHYPLKIKTYYFIDFNHDDSDALMPAFSLSISI